MPATKLELLIKMLKRQITEYGKINKVAAMKFQEMLEKTIEEYHERRKHLTLEEAGETQELASEDIIKAAKYANATGALVVSKSGASSSIPTQSEVEIFIS